MKVKRVSRWNCDFCGKGFWRTALCKSHEEFCIFNSNRRCMFCEEIGRVKLSDSELEEILTGNGAQELATITCPRCALSAVMRINKKDHFSGEDKYYFDYGLSKRKWRERYFPQEFENLEVI